MKIVSLQSVGLGAIFSGGNGATGFNEPYTIIVGENLYDERGNSLGVTVTDSVSLSAPSFSENIVIPPTKYPIQIYSVIYVKVIIRKIELTDSTLLK